MSYTSTIPNRDNVTEGQLTIDIRPLLEDVSQVMTKHISSILSGVVGEYTVYKETHETIMGLPCVRKLEERISELENQLNGGPAPTSSPCATSSSPSEISELQSAIIELNRYIQVLEARMDVKAVVSNSKEPHQHQHQQPQHEEAIKLEVQETDIDMGSASDEDDDEIDLVCSSFSLISTITTPFGSRGLIILVISPLHHNTPNIPLPFSTTVPVPVPVPVPLQFPSPVLCFSCEAIRSCIRSGGVNFPLTWNE